MKIAVLGSGNVGGALAAAAGRAGHDVTLTARDPGHARRPPRRRASGPRTPTPTPSRERSWWCSPSRTGPSPRWFHAVGAGSLRLVGPTAPPTAPPADAA